MLEVVVFAVRRFQVKGLFRDEGGNVLVLLFFGGFGGLSGHDGDDEKEYTKVRWPDGCSSGGADRSSCTNHENEFN